MDLQFGNPNSFAWLWIVLGCAAVLAVAWNARRRAIARFATAALVPQMIPQAGARRAVVSGLLVLTSLAALVLALADIRWGRAWREVPQKGIEVMFVLDVSRSMLAEDVTPNRLTRAQQQMKDLVDVMHGDRVGLVVFAGEARRVVPLTSNIRDFKQALDEVGPHSVRRGGSQLGDAIRLASDAFLDKTEDHKAIFVVTDGEDHESDPIAAAKRALDEKGIRVFAIGLGDRARGARIPIQQVAHRAAPGRSYLQHGGQQVWSRMDDTTLKQVALAGGGVYIPAETKQVDMADVYYNTIANIDQADFDVARIHAYNPKYAWFVGFALALLLVDTLRPLRRRAMASTRSRTSSLAIVGLLALGTLGFAPSPAEAARPAEIVREANRALEMGDFDAALSQYEEAAKDTSAHHELEYNRAIAHYRKGNMDEARRLFTQALAADPLESPARFNLANCDYSEAVGLAQQDRPAAIAKLESAISHYRGALRAAPEDTDARANIELARMLMDQLRQEEAKEQEEQKQKQQQQDNPQQQDNEDQDKQNEPGQDGESQSQDESEEDGEQEGRESKEGQSQDAPEKEQPHDANPETSSEKKSEQEEDSKGSQRQGDPGNVEPGDEGSTQGAASSDTDTDAKRDEKERARVMTREEAEKMLQSVRDRDLRRRWEQLREMQRHHRPVDRDW